MTSTENIRNIGIIAHIDAGKTTVSERILFYSNKIHRMGEVHDGTATMDFMPEEQERGITITAACTSLAWADKTINLIDTPGHVDFTMEVERSLRVLDGAVGVFCAVGGVEPQSETVWQQSEKFMVPKLAFVNKMDRTGADFASVLDAMRERLGANPVPLVLPVGAGENFVGLIDLIAMQRLDFDQADQGRSLSVSPLSDAEQELAAPWRESMLEKIADADDDFLELWMGGSFGEAGIHAALCRATRARRLTPVFCGSALRNIGIQPLLDAVCRYLPSPADCPDDSPALLATDADGKQVRLKDVAKSGAVALVFKIVIENGRKLAMLRIYAGKITTADILHNVSRDSDDRIGRIYRLHADKREQLEEAQAGDIVAVVGLRSAHTGETFTSKGAARLLLESVSSQEPVMTLALEPLNASEGSVMDEALARYTEEDPTLRVSLDEDSGSRILSGMGELHLDVVLERMARECSVRPRTGQPQVVLRETISREADAKNVFDRDLGKEHHQGVVSLAISPLPRNAGIRIKPGDWLPEDPQEARKILPRPLLDAVVEGINLGLQSGPASGWPVTDIAVTITGVERTEGLTTAPGCQMAAGFALRDALEKAGSLTLEPVMKIGINVPEEYLGATISLVMTRGGKVEDVAEHAGNKLVSGTAPLRKLFGFATALRSVTQGRAGLVQTFDRFDLP